MTLLLLSMPDADLEVTINEGMGTYYFGDEDLDGETLEDQL